MLLTGPSIDMTRLDAVVQATMPGADAPTVTTRSLALQGLTGAPLQQGTFLLFTLAIAYAAALALAVMLLELALGTADRELTTARLATMGLTEGQRVRLVAIEVIPSIVASAVAAVVCASPCRGWWPRPLTYRCSRTPRLRCRCDQTSRRSWSRWPYWSRSPSSRWPTRSGQGAGAASP
jgi:hypothetical protein